MNPTEVTGQSTLDKPLAELTEEDIAQLTREDCRRFLKSKGMRRPSWNKSQAIQQVISLKALIEGRLSCDDCPAGGGILQKARPRRSSPAPASPPQDPRPPLPTKEGGGSEPPATEPSPYRRRDLISPLAPPYSAGVPTCRVAIAVADQPHPPPENRCLSPRVTADLPAAAQMTIFYDGTVSVYEGVAFDQVKGKTLTRRPVTDGITLTPSRRFASQARAVLELAASAVCFDDVTSPISPVRPSAFRFPAGLPESSAALPFARAFPFSTAAGRVGHYATDGWEDGRAQRETEPEGTASRKASLQRYLEKRKDRFKGKKVLGGSTSSNMEMMYFSQKLRCTNPNELTNLNDASLHTLPQVPGSPARCSSIENQIRREKFFIDLNDDGGGDY